MLWCNLEKPNHSRKWDYNNYKKYEMPYGDGKINKILYTMG